jgi:CRP-like cAMP-binding protein
MVLHENFEIGKKDAFLKCIISKLGTCLAIPEEEVISQNDSGSDMFYISKGDCAVNIKDKKGNHHVAISLLVQGNHFGEIALIYKCKRTATIVSRNYNTMARLGYSNWREIVNEFPKFLQYLKFYLYGYGDENKKFLIDMVRNVFYFREGLNRGSVHDLIYQLKPTIYEKGNTVLKENDLAKELIFVENGVLEVYTEFEGNEFILERLHSGSCINYRSFLMEDTMAVNIRCLETCTVLKLGKETFV